MSGGQLYDTIGAAYTVTRRTEPRIAAQVWAALGDARTVLNVGAGTGSDEPRDRDVTAVEPSALMRAQRAGDAGPCVAAAAESLPFADSVLRRRDGLCHRSSLAGPHVGPARDAAGGSPRGGVHAMTRPEAVWLWSVLAYSRLPALGRRARWMAGLRCTELAGASSGARTEPGADPVGWRRRLLRGEPAAARGIPGLAGTSRSIGVGDTSGPTPSSGRCAPSATTLTPASGPNATATSSILTRRARPAPA